MSDEPSGISGITRLHRFELEKHTGPYEAWPLASRLIVDGRMLPLAIPGYTLLFQFDTPSGYLFATDFDCPFEEAASFVLVSRDLRRILGARVIGAPYCSFWLDDIRWLDATRFVAIFADDPYHWRFTIRKRGIAWRWLRWLCPRLTMARFKTDIGGVQPEL